MNDVKRWAPFPNDEPDFFVVAASDYDALAAENAKLREVLGRVRDGVRKVELYQAGADYTLPRDIDEALRHTVQPSEP